jgi:hypothetical protein
VGGGGYVLEGIQAKGYLALPVFLASEMKHVEDEEEHG